MKKRKIRMLCLALSLVILTSLSAGCGKLKQQDMEGKTEESKASEDKKVETAKEQPLLEYSAWIGRVDSRVEKIANNPNDVVTPYIEKKFNIKVKDIQIAQQGETAKQALAKFAAAGNIPDVMIADKQACQDLVASGKFADMTEILKEMPNYSRFMSDTYWPRFMSNSKKFILPQPIVHPDNPAVASNPYKDTNFGGWALFTREDILKKCGYSFTPLEEIAKKTTEQGKLPTAEDLKIEPAIDTPEKFEEYLTKIKELNLSVGGKPVIPMSIPFWSVMHVSTMFDAGVIWRINDNGEVDGNLGLPGSKDFYRFWNRLYNKGLVDKDYLIQKDDQLQEKFASGRAVVGMFTPDLTAVRQALVKKDPSQMIRFIPWPKKQKGLGWIDIFEGGYWSVVISKETKDIKRLAQYFDWLNSDEGLDIMTWGPESAGLWEVKDGKKKFKADVAKDILDNAKEGKNAEYYGILNPSSGEFQFSCKAALCAPVISGVIPTDWRANYPLKYNIHDILGSLLYKYNDGNNFNTIGTGSYGDGGPNTTVTSNYFWSKWVNTEIAKILTPKTDKEFEIAWAEVYEKFEREGKYKESKADMEKWFQLYGPKK